eukprot:Trichotokara_eunicae@DN5402_c2_g1_i1.p1
MPAEIIDSFHCPNLASSIDLRRIFFDAVAESVNALGHQVSYFWVDVKTFLTTVSVICGAIATLYYEFPKDSVAIGYLAGTFFVISGLTMLIDLAILRGSSGAVIHRTGKGERQIFVNLKAKTNEIELQMGETRARDNVGIFFNKEGFVDIQRVVKFTKGVIVTEYRER